uniref:Probable molybdenum cofactor guanylyltransferase n=1 Tax=Schlesneria paludicola TaxID=360056 RepID=A0A7C4QQ27_9PLAN
MRHGAIVLCGGRSSRMGRDKATLPFGPELMLQRVVRLISEVVKPEHIVVVAAAQQNLPPLPGDIAVARDARPGRGPLEGLAAGLRLIGGQLDAVYATACDVPLLVPAFARHLFTLLEDYDIAVPTEGDFHHPLAAVYRPRVLPAIERLLAAGELRPRALFAAVATREVPVDELRCVDPRLETLLNLNRPEDYHSALVAAGFAAP